MYASAIARLEALKESCEHNAPIQEADGRKSQAKLSRATAKAYALAIEALQ